MVHIVLVVFLTDDHCHSCEAHSYRCGNTLIEGKGNNMAHLVRLCLVEKVNLAIEFHHQPNWDSGMIDRKLVGNDMKYSAKNIISR